MKKNLLLMLIAICGCVFSSQAEGLTVTLKIIDLTKGAVTNPSTSEDNTDANIYTWLSDELKALNPRTPDDWWYPMYAVSSVTPSGEMVMTDEALEWRITLQVEPGEYEWNPGAKSLGWKDINPNMFPWEGGNPKFEVAADGTITGTTEIIITKFEEGTMILGVTVPAGTEKVFVRGLYGNWDVPIEMTYMESENLWIYEIIGGLIPVGQDQNYKYYYGDDSWEKIEADADGNKRPDGDNRILVFENGGQAIDDVVAAWYQSGSGIKDAQTNKNFDVSISGNNVIVTGIYNSVNVYTITGQSAGMTGLMPGFYIVNVDGISQKMMIK